MWRLSDLQTEEQIRYFFPDLQMCPSFIKPSLNVSTHMAVQSDLYPSELYTFFTLGREFSSINLHAFYTHGTVFTSSYHPSKCECKCETYLHSRVDWCFSEVVNVTQLFRELKGVDLHLCGTHWLQRLPLNTNDTDTNNTSLQKNGEKARYNFLLQILFYVTNAEKLKEIHMEFVLSTLNPHAREAGTRDSFHFNNSSRALNHISRFLSCISGQLISNKKEELMAILDHFNIQVRTHTPVLLHHDYSWRGWAAHLFCVFQLDNPVSILNQEMSKQFLHSKSESDKYKVQRCRVILRLHLHWEKIINRFIFQCVLNECLWPLL